MTEGYTWNNCRNEQNASACRNLCDQPESYSWLTAAQTEVACVWANAPYMGDDDIFYTECRANGNVDWCTYACIDARDNLNGWYLNSEKDEACESETWYDGTEAASDDESSEA